MDILRHTHFAKYLMPQFTYDSHDPLMISKLYISLIAILYALFIPLSGCKKQPHPLPIPTPEKWTGQDYLNAAQNNALAVELMPKNKIAKNKAQQGIQFAKQCILLLPNNAGCYYWHAVNTGLYYQIRIIGYQRGIKQMIADANKVIVLDRYYAHGGAHRMLGQLYLELPQTTIHPDDITRNIELSLNYLQGAVTLSPNFPENRLLLARAYLKLNQIQDAIEEFTHAKALVLDWQENPSYLIWKKQIEQIEKNLNNLID